MTTSAPRVQTLSRIALLGSLLAGQPGRPAAFAAGPGPLSAELPPATLEAASAADRRADAAAPDSPLAPTLTLSVRDAMLLAVERNASFDVERLAPLIAGTQEEQARAAFDPLVSGSASKTDIRGADTDPEDTLGAEASLRKAFPAGTAVELGAGRGAASASLPARWSYDARITQALLRGRGAGANLVRLRQARLDTLLSAYELRGVAETLVAQVETAYWNRVLAERAIAIYERSLAVAEQQAGEVRERIRIGLLAEPELTAVEAELASRRERLIDARSAFEKVSLNLLRLLNPAPRGLSGTRVVLTESPESAADGGDLDAVEAHVALGLARRADLNQARLAVARGQLEVVRTRNGLLPKLDLFVRLGGTSYAESFSTQEKNDWTREAQAGAQLEYALGNRSEKADHRRAELSLEQADKALLNMRQLVETEVRVAWLEARRSREQITATEATRALREETLRIEVERLRIGKSTALLVAQASRDLLESQIASLSALIEYRKALLALYRQEGSILERHGFEAPGADEAAADRAAE